MKRLLPLLTLALVACDQPVDTQTGPSILEKKVAKLEAENQKLKADLERQKAAPTIPLGEEAAIRLTRLTRDHDVQEPEIIREDKDWLLYNVFGPLRKVYDDRDEAEMFDAWRRPANEEMYKRAQEKGRKNAEGFEAALQGLQDDIRARATDAK